MQTSAIVYVSLLSVAAGCAAGSVDGRARRNQVDAANDANTERPAVAPAEVHFREVEALLGPAVKEWLPSVGTPPPIALRVYLQDTAWNVERNPVSGIAVRRSVNVTVIIKGGQSGNCIQRLGGLVEDEQGGGSWGRATLVMPLDASHAQRVTCASVQGLRGAPQP